MHASRTVFKSTSSLHTSTSQSHSGRSRTSLHHSVRTPHHLLASIFGLLFNPPKIPGKKKKKQHFYTKTPKGAMLFAWFYVRKNLQKACFFHWLCNKKTKNIKKKNKKHGTWGVLVVTLASFFETMAPWTSPARSALAAPRSGSGPCAPRSERKGLGGDWFGDPMVLLVLLVFW